MRLVTVTLALDVTSEEEAYDAVNEILREHQRHFAPGSSLLDYAIGKQKVTETVEVEGYEEGEMLEALPFPRPYK